jgi:hypothetical protein
MVHKKNALGMSLLVRVRSGVDFAAAVGAAAAGGGTGFRLGDPATLPGMSMIGGQRGSLGARCRDAGSVIEIQKWR